MSEKKRLFKNTLSLLTIQGATYIFPLLTFPYLTRILGVDKYGVVVFANSIMVYFQLLIDYGFLISGTRECSLDRKSKEKLGQIIGSIVQCKAVLAVIGGVILLIISNFSIMADSKMFLYLSYFSVCFYIFIPEYFFRGIEEMRWLTYHTIISKGIYTIAIFMFIKEPNDYTLIPILTTLSNLYLVLVYFYIISIKLKIKVTFVDTKDVMKKLQKTFDIFISRIASSIYGTSNTFILGITKSTFLGSFGAASTLILNVRSLFSPIADSLYPYMINKKDYKIVKKILLIIMPVITIGTIFMFVFAEQIILLACGKEYLDAVPVFKIMLFIVLITLPTYALGFPILGAFGKIKEVNNSVVISTLFHIIGLSILFFSDNLNVITISILTCITESLVLAIRCIYIYRYRNEIIIRGIKK